MRFIRYTHALPGRFLVGAGILVAFVTIAGPGCSPSNQLETGYRYTPLSSTESQRRAFYADPYSADARRAEIERGDNFRNSPLSNPR